MIRFFVFFPEKEREMSSPNTELSSSREKLFAVLGKHQAKYQELLNNWFSSKSSKEQFDAEARKLLTSRYISLHNQFLLAILNKCQSQEDFSPTLRREQRTELLSPERLKTERSQGN